MAKWKLLMGYLVTVVGIGLLAAGVTIKLTFPTLFREKIYENLALEEGTEGWKQFVEPEVPVHILVYMYDVLNPDDITKVGAKPLLAERGPYAYRETRRKEDILLTDSEHLDYSLFQSYKFDQEKTNQLGCRYNGFQCSTNDSVTVLNVPLMAIAESSTPLLKFIHSLKLSLVISGPVIIEALDSVFKSDPFTESVFKEVTVQQMLFDGFPTGALHAIQNLTLFVETFVSELTDGISLHDVLDKLHILDQYLKFMSIVQDAVNLMLPEQLSGGRFGILKGKNGTKTNSYYRINTGKFDRHKFAQLELVNGAATLPDHLWPFVAATPSGQEAGLKGICHDISGTDGQQYPPFVTKNDQIWIFVSDLCRSIYLEFEKEVEHFGIPMLRFRPTKDIFLMDNPMNFCYCPEFLECAQKVESADQWNITNCRDLCKDGILKVKKCYGANLMVSNPHFYRADSRLIDGIDGLAAADPAQHDTHLDIEPNTGASMTAHKRIQMNMPMIRNEYISIMNQINDVVLPVLWIDEGAELDQETANKFNDQVLWPSRLTDGLAIGLGIVLGLVLILLGIYLIFKGGRN